MPRPPPRCIPLTVSTRHVLVFSLLLIALASGTARAAHMEPGVIILDGTANRFVVTAPGGIDPTSGTFVDGAPYFDGVLFHYAPSSGTSSWNLAAFDGTHIVFTGSPTTSGSFRVEIPSGALHVVGPGLDRTSTGTGIIWDSPAGAATYTVTFVPPPPSTAEILNANIADSASVGFTLVVSMLLVGLAFTLYTNFKERHER